MFESWAFMIYYVFALLLFAAGFHYYKSVSLNRFAQYAVAESRLKCLEERGSGLFQPLFKGISKVVWVDRSVWMHVCGWVCLVIYRPFYNVF